MQKENAMIPVQQYYKDLHSVIYFIQIFTTVKVLRDTPRTVLAISLNGGVKRAHEP